MNSVLQRLFYRHGWDTRSRNRLPARVLRKILMKSPAPDGFRLLDVGCSNLGIASMFPDLKVAGVDLETPSATPANVKFHLGSVMALPFRDKSFPVVTCIDVLEHLPVESRPAAISEIVRVASTAILIACPHGPIARACDEEFRRASTAHGRPLPSWVEEHLRQTYPDPSALQEMIETSAATRGLSAKLSTWYCESASVSRLVRRAAARSDLLYLFVNLLFGTLLPLFPLPSAGASYRLVLLAELGTPVSA